MADNAPISPYEGLTPEEQKLLRAQTARTEERIRKKKEAKEAEAEAIEEAEELRRIHQEEVLARNAAFVMMRTAQAEREQSFLVKPKKKAVFGMAFWGMLLLCMAKDAVDVLTALLQAAGAALTSSLILSIIGMPLLGTAFLLNFVVSLFVNMAILVYFYLRGDLNTRKMITRGLTALIETIPNLNILPLTTIMFIGVHILEAMGGAITKPLTVKS